jgi:hypothetical protein
MKSLFEGRNYGSFEIPGKILADDPKLVMLITSRMIIIRAEFMLAYDAIEYQAYSPDHFRKTKLGLQIPAYDIIITREKDGTAEFHFEERKL